MLGGATSIFSLIKNSFKNPSHWLHKRNHSSHETGFQVVSVIEVGGWGLARGDFGGLVMVEVLIRWISCFVGYGC